MLMLALGVIGWGGIVQTAAAISCPAGCSVEKGETYYDNDGVRQEEEDRCLCGGVLRDGVLRDGVLLTEEQALAWAKEKAGEGEDEIDQEEEGGSVLLHVPIGGENLVPCSEGSDKMCQEITYHTGTKNSLLAEYTKLIYGYVRGIIILLVTAMIVWGGVEWTMSGGSQEAITSGKEKIISALIGLALFIVAGLLLKTINPDLFG